jgi:glycosyltransferase involved in cell wall biosynthesis
MAHGVPVVTTTIGGEGIGLVHGRHALVADTPESFVAEVARLYEEPALWSALAAEGRSLVAERYSPEAVGRRLHAALADMGVLDAGAVLSR